MTINKGQTYILEVLLLDSLNQRISGKTIGYKIYRSDTNDLVEEGEMEDKGNGLYQASYQFDNEGQYRIEYLMPEGWTDLVETVNVVNNVVDTVEEIYNRVTDVLDIVKRVLGLSQENYILEPISYNQFVQLTEGRIKIFANSNDCLNEVNPTASYYVQADYDNEGKLVKYKVIKE